jgi:hypothetical protein
VSVVALVDLAVPRASADRRRWLLVAAACAGAATVILAGLRILRFSDLQEEVARSGVTYASYIQEPGLRVGILFGALLCCVPPLVLLVQALRVGSAARERRLIAIRVAGASRRQLRSLALIEGASAGVAGSAVGAVGYLVLGVVTLRIPDFNLRIIPLADAIDLLVVPVVLLLLALLAGLSAMLSARDVVVAPQRVNLRAPRPLPRSRAVVASALLVGLVVGVPAALWLYLVVETIFGLMCVFVAFVFVAAPYLVLAAARWLDRSPDPMRQLAAARLRAEPRSPGRIVAVLAVCGTTFSMGLAYIAAVPSFDRDGDEAFFRAGAMLAIAAAVVALTVSVLSLIVAAAEQILDARRATAVLTAFGVSFSDLRRALRRQLTSITVLAAGLGAAIGALAVALPFGGWPGLAAVVGVVVAVVAGTVAAWIPTVFLAPQIAEATSAENLRTA